MEKRGSEEDGQDSRLSGGMLLNDDSVPKMDAGPGSALRALGTGAEGIDQKHVFAASSGLPGVFLFDGSVPFRGGVIAPDGP